MSANTRVRSSILTTALTATLLLAGCDGIDSMKSTGMIKDTFDTNQQRIDQAAGKTKATRSDDPLSISEDVWVGNQAVRMRSGQPLPVKFESDRGFSMVSGAPMGLGSIASQVANVTTIPVRMNNMALGTAEGGSSAEESPEAKAIALMSMYASYEGPLSVFLDQVASHFDISWRYDGNTIQFYRYETRTFNVEALPGKMSIEDKFDTGSGGGSGGGSSSSEDMTQKNEQTSEMDYWKDLEANLKAVVGQLGLVSIMPSSGTITVSARPAKLEQVANYLDQENVRLSRQVAIDVTIYNVTMRDTDSYGLELDAVFRGKLFGRDTSTFTFDSPTVPSDPSSVTQGSLSVALLGPGWQVQNAVPKALSTVGNVSVVTRSPIVTLNNRPASRKITVDRAYLASIETTLSEGVTTTAITPGNIVTGFTLQLLPRLMADNRIMLQYSLRLSDLVGEPTTITSAGNTIQLPEVDNKIFVQQAVLQSGSTLVLAGFERNRASDASRGIGSATNWLLGGGMSNDQKREQLVVTITPREITPERGSMAGS